MQFWIKTFVAIMVVMYLFPCGHVMAQENDSKSSGRSSRSSGRSSSRSTGGTVDDKDRRREDRSKSRESNSRSSSRSKKTGGESKKDDKKADTKTVEGSKKPKSSGKASSGGRPTVDIAFEMQVDPETNVMYIESVGQNPSLSINVLEGKLFVTRLALYNPKASAFSQLDASIKFDPQLVEPVGVDDNSIKSNLDRPSRVLVDRKTGLLSVAADFKEPRSDSFMTLAKIQWRALAPVAGTPLSFVNTKDHPSGVFDSAGKNILHFISDETVQASAKSGLLDATVIIDPTHESTKAANTSNNPFSAVAMATNISMGTAEGGVQLFLRPRTHSVKTGEEFIVDIMYRNPRRADMDMVKLKIRFDPVVLQVIDSDDGNWITRGINIFDGAYHDELPFDFHRKNSAFNNLGLITYDMGFGSRVTVPSQGVIASIRFRAIESSAGTQIVFDSGAEGAEKPNTAISFLGFNLIGKPGERKQAMTNTVVSVLPH